MRVIIAGSRDIYDYELLTRTIFRSGFKIDRVVCGMARGIDSLGKKWAEKKGIPVDEFPADWSLGKSAGYIRNQQMAENADALIAITNGSRGTANMIKIAKEKGLKVFVVEVFPSDICHT